MPFINVKTNVSVTPDAMTSIKSELGKAVTAIPGKSEAWLMVGIEPEYALWFKGSSEPAAMVEVSIFGGADHSAYQKLTALICDILQKEIDVPASRTYVKYAETENWGWNGSNF